MLSTFTTNPPGQLNILGHDRDPLGVNRAEISILKQTHKVRLSRLLEHHPLFPERTSVMWSHEIAPDRFRVRIWERGAGETYACGTGACAVAVAAHLSGRAGRRVEVASRGGTLTIEIGEDLSLYKTGPASHVFRGQWP